jgi:hypothetical protein
MTKEERQRRAAVRAVAPLSKPPQMGEAFLDKPGPPSASHPKRQPQAGEEPEDLPVPNNASHFS